MNHMRVKAGPFLLGTLTTVLYRVAAIIIVEIRVR